MSATPPRPSSPTDNLMSPCSKSLFGSKKNLNKLIRPASIRQDFSLAAQVQPQPCPAHNMKLIFGTSSSCRKNVIDALKWDYEQICADIDGKTSFICSQRNTSSDDEIALIQTSLPLPEKAIRHDDPMEMPVLIAKAKAEAIMERERMLTWTEPAVLLTFDQIVLHRTNVREKPESRAEAVEYLSSYSGDAVSTVSAVVVTHIPSGIQMSSIDIATVYWRDISSEVVERVVDRGEVMSSAGGFLIEDEDLNGLIKGIDRPVDSVMGMPVDLTKRLIKDVLLTVANLGTEEHKSSRK